MHDLIRHWLTAIVLMSLFSLESWSATPPRRPTPDYYKCTGRVSGTWLFGQVPQACNASAFGPDSEVTARFGYFIYHDKKSGDGETERFSAEFFTLLTEAADTYLRLRNPNASLLEQDYFRRAVLTVAQQETLWSHYRLARDRKIKMIRGDLGHGHGLMQIDDRFHFDVVNTGEAWHLMYNLRYGLEIFYEGWLASIHLPCVQGEADYESRIRSSYSHYNGGEERGCRWRDPNDKWSKNDVAFWKKYQSQEWHALFKAPAPSRILVSCYFDRSVPCVESVPEPYFVQASALNPDDGWVPLPSRPLRSWTWQELFNCWRTRCLQSGEFPKQDLFELGKEIGIRIANGESRRDDRLELLRYPMESVRQVIAETAFQTTELIPTMPIVLKNVLQSGDAGLLYRLLTTAKVPARTLWTQALTLVSRAPLSLGQVEAIVFSLKNAPCGVNKISELYHGASNWILAQLKSYEARCALPQ